MKNYIIGKKKFTQKDQLNFAKFSCDFNHIHINPISVRRSIHGAQVVHGVNILLCALNYYFKKKNIIKFKKIKCIFMHPVIVNKTVDFILEERKENINIKITDSSKVYSIITLSKDNVAFREKLPKHNVYYNKINKINKSYINKNFSEIKKKNRYYIINLCNFKSSSLYNNLKKYLSNLQIKEILSLSYFVGMVCPGYNSILSSIDINFDNQISKNENINFSLKKFDKRVNLLKTYFSNRIFGTVNSFTYPGEVKQPPISKIKKFIYKKEFSKINTLIIGGSRGLGELTAKILVSGGANTTITYYQGIKEAKKLKENIKFETGQICKIKKLNVISKDFIDKIKNCLNKDFIFYYPTPKISSTKNENFSNEKFEYYYKFYVKQFTILCNFIEKYSDKQIIIFYPSTIFVLNESNNFKEYVKAKLIAEKKIKEINKNFKNVKIISHRLPQLNTDQTSGVINTSKNDNIKVMVPIIKSLINNKKVGKSFYLRVLSAKDINKDYLSWLKDPLVNQYLDVRFSTPNHKQAIENLHTYDNKKRFFFGIFSKKNNKFIGTTTLRINEVKKEALYGYLIGDKGYWGTTAGIESFALCLNFLFDNFNLNKVIGGTYSNNIPSIFNFYKLGFTLDRRLKKEAIFKGSPIDRLLFSTSKKKWRQRRKRLSY